MPRQISLPAASRGTARHFRYGPAAQALGDPSFRYTSHAFAGNGLRPYPVVHLRATPAGGDLAVSWTRCTPIPRYFSRVCDVALNGDGETYRVDVMEGGQVRREVVTGAPSWTYAAADMVSDTGGAAYTIAVAQLSDRYGAGPETVIAQP